MLPDPGDVDNPTDVAEVAPPTPEVVIDDIVADYTMMVAPGEESDGLFSLDKDYDENGIASERNNISMLAGIKDILSYLETDTSSKDFVRAVDEKITQTNDLTVLKLLQHFLIHPDMQVFWDNNKRIGKGNMTDKLAKKITELQETKNKADNEKKNKETIKTQEEMIDMLLGITTLPKTKE